MKEYKKPTDPRKPGQLIQRARVSAASAFLSGFRKIIDIGYQGSETYTMGYMEALDYHIKNALRDVTPEGAEKPVFMAIPEKVILSRGLIEAPKIDVCERVGDKISLSWDPTLGPQTNRLYDSMVIVSWQSGENACVDYHAGCRDDGSGTTILPTEFTGKVHLWAFYMNQEKNRLKTKANISDSIYLGEF